MKKGQSKSIAHSNENLYEPVPHGENQLHRKCDRKSGTK